METKEIQTLFQESENSLSQADKLEIQASSLAMDFLGLIDAEMQAQNMNKKELAKAVGTSAAYITQLFMGDRLPNFKILAKMQAALQMKFKVGTEQTWQEELQTELFDYHNKWVKTQYYIKDKLPEASYQGVLSLAAINGTDYALAG